MTAAHAFGSSEASEYHPRTIAATVGYGACAPALRDFDRRGHDRVSAVAT